MQYWIRCKVDNDWYIIMNLNVSGHTCFHHSTADPDVIYYTHTRARTRARTHTHTHTHTHVCWEGLKKNNNYFMILNGHLLNTCHLHQSWTLNIISEIFVDNLLCGPKNYMLCWSSEILIYRQNELHGQSCNIFYVIMYTKTITVPSSLASSTRILQSKIA
jgi:hypothetical protein